MSFTKLFLELFYLFQNQRYVDFLCNSLRETPCIHGMKAKLKMMIHRQDPTVVPLISVSADEVALTLYQARVHFANTKGSGTRNDVEVSWNSGDCRGIMTPTKELSCPLTIPYNICKGKVARVDVRCAKKPRRIKLRMIVSQNSNIDDARINRVLIWGWQAVHGGTQRKVVCEAKFTTRLGSGAVQRNCEK